MKKWKEDTNSITPFDYILFKKVPMRETVHGIVIDCDPGALEYLAAEAILRERIPLRGKEVQFLRKVAGLSMEKFANKLGLTSGTVFHWEKNSEERLLVVNEIAVKSLIADLLDIEISGKLSDLIGDKIKSIVLKAA